LAVAKRTKEGLLAMDGKAGKSETELFEKEFGPVIIFRPVPSKDMECAKLFEGLGKVYLVNKSLPTGTDWSCSEFEGVKEVEKQKCEIEFTNMCDKGAEQGNCGLMQTVASVDYPTCKKKDCPYVFQQIPWVNALGQPSFKLEFESEHKVAALSRGNCAYSAATMARFMDLFWSSGPGPWIPDHTTQRRLIWASLWLLAIGIGAGVASCCCARGGSPEQEEVGAELMS